MWLSKYTQIEHGSTRVKIENRNNISNRPDFDVDNVVKDD
jgi:hypothetical protein